MKFFKNLYVRIALVSVLSFLVIFQIVYDIIALSEANYINSDFITKELIIVSLIISVFLLALCIYLYVRIIKQAIKNK
ncbi:MAG: hypothetical protein ACOX4W_04585 [Bacilli bacterium]